MRDLKYFCKTCKTVKPPKIELQDNPNSTVPIPLEVFVTFPAQKIQKGDRIIEREEYKARKLECGHFVKADVFGFHDSTTENLDEFEIQDIRRMIDKSILGKNAAELEQAILFHAETYETFRKITAKQQKQAKYALQYVEQLKERYKEQLSNEADKQSLDMKFAAFLGERPISNKTLDRERTKVEKAVDKQKAALEALKALVAKTGYDPKDLFGGNGESKKGE